MENSYVVHSYGLFSAISTLLKQEMSPHLGTIVGYMLESLRSVEGLKVCAL